MEEPTQRLSARQLIMDLVQAHESHRITAKQAIGAGELFGIVSNATRVTLTRLVQDGLLESRGRGQYQIGPAGLDLVNDITTWRNRDQHLCAWQGGFLIVAPGLSHEAPGRTQANRRQRALALLGFKALHPGLWLRPDNLALSLSDLSQRLHTLGLETDALVGRLDDVADDWHERIRQLWDRAVLNTLYQHQTQVLTEWLERAEQLPLAEAACESFLMGRAAVRALVYDPLLPDDWIDAAARQNFFEQVRRYDQVGQALWARVYERLNAGVPLNDAA